MRELREKQDEMEENMRRSQVSNDTGIGTLADLEEEGKVTELDDMQMESEVL